MEIFAAGGAIRDLLLGHPMRDADFVFAATEDAFILCYPAARKTQGGAFPVYLLNEQEFSPLPQRLSLSEALERDLLRRDFTINALLLSESGMLHCHPQALHDLHEGRIRPASASALADDPIRAFRAARFAACFSGFRVHQETLEQMRALPCPDLAAIAAERVGRETLKACHGEKPGNFLRILHDGHCLAPWFVEFARAHDIPAGPAPFHDSSVLEHTARIMDKTAQNAVSTWPGRENARERALAVWMALCHDIGKTITPVELLPRHHGHAAAGTLLARTLASRLRLPALFVKAGALASGLHMKAADYSRLRPGTRVDLLMTLHNAHLFHPFLCMIAADADMPELPGLMRRDLDSLLAVSLPEDWRERGRASGERLRDMRCMVLARRR